MNVFNDALKALEVEAQAAEAANELYKDAGKAFSEIDEKYRLLRGEVSGKPALSKIKSFIMDNKGALMAAAAAFGIPVGLADSGAFSTITGLLGKVGGLFGIG